MSRCYTANLGSALTHIYHQPYLSLAGLLGVGSVGVREGHSLQIGNCDGETAALLDEAGRRALGITQRMSLTWEESRKAFNADKVLRSVLGNEMVDTYLTVNEASVSFKNKLRSVLQLMCYTASCQTNGRRH